MNKYIFPLKVDKFYTSKEGKFASKRKYDIHTGLDIYTAEGTPVYAIEDGIVIYQDWFTGLEVGSSFWNTTSAIVIQGKHTFVYGELKLENYTLGNKVKQGDLLGFVAKVLKKDKGRPMSMLHLELYKNSWSPEDGFAEWSLDKEKPWFLKNIENSFIKKYFSHMYRELDLDIYRLALKERRLYD